MSWLQAVVCHRVRAGVPCLSIFVIASLCGLSAAAGAQSAPQAVTTTNLRTVEMTPAQQIALGVRTEALGSREPLMLRGMPATVVVPPQQQRVVAAPLAGLLDQVTVAPNDPVRAGQVIGRMQSPALAELHRGFVQASVQSQLAGETAARDRSLFEDGLIAEARLRSSHAQLAEAKALLVERRQALKLAGLDDAALVRLASGLSVPPTIALLAPIDGTVLEQTVAVGSRVEAASPLFRIARLSPLWLEVQVPVAVMGRVSPGAAVRVPSVGASGRVLSIGRNAGANQSVAVRAEIRDAGAALVPGQTVEASLAPSMEGRTGWRIPMGAVTRSGEQALVLVATPKGFSAVPVQVLDEDDRSALVTGALSTGERIAVQGIAALKARLLGIGGE
jgi:cobalt-zinc-cadmium efflux system membrane fusion protein